MSASVVLRLQAFVFAAMERFVGLILAIRRFVAHFGVGDALFVLFAHELVRGASRVLSAAVFVASVAAVVLAVALVVFGNALGVVASEFFFRNAGSEVVFAVFAFVRPVAAIVVVIAPPKLVNASSVVALELVFVTGFALGGTVGNHVGVFVGAVNAVGIAVTQPLSGNAHGAAVLFVGLAFEFRLGITGSSVAILSRRFV